MLVLKFGGTSTGSPEAIEKIIAITKDKIQAGKVSAQVIVVSAFSGVTDALIEAGRIAEGGSSEYERILEALEKRHLTCADHFLKGEERKAAAQEISACVKELRGLLYSVAILKELSPRTLDRIQSFGEYLSAALIAKAFCARGIAADFLDSRRVIKTDENFGKARFLKEETTKQIQTYIHEHPNLQIACGFIGSTLEGVTTTLGRGGSDLSAAIFGASLDADEIEIWTDVDGIMTADPKLVKDAFTIKTVSYGEAMELSHFGAKVLHPPTIQPALDKNIPIRILNTFNPASCGTLISGKPQRRSGEAEMPVKGVSSIPNVTLVLVQGTGMVGVAGFASRLFSALSQKQINVILITQASSEYSICFAVMPEDGESASAVLNEEFEHEIMAGFLDKPLLTRNLAIIAVVGSNMESTSGISGKVFYALGRNGVNVVAIAQGSSEINISCVIAKKDRAKALNSIHEAFFLSGTRSVNLFLVGLGLIGGTLLDQIASQQETLAEEHKIRINITGIANSKLMFFNAEGIPPLEAKKLLKTGSPFNPDEFISLMKNANLPNTAFCDCTASGELAAMYEEILRSSIPVVTPNKKANSGSLEYYKRLTEFSRDRGIPYLYEVTVCAGLPVISTLRDLHLSGDVVLRIEAVLSGTLSFIFNNFDGSTSFSALVREAKEKGYTEPDPRDDLNAMDAARKALILARECSMPLEFSAVQIDPILPEACFKAKSVEDFFCELEKSDADFEKLRAEAASCGKVLRYVAVIEAGSARLALRAEAADSPFRSLVDADNIVVITSERYKKLPMVIKGPGAGAQVTAAGVFADIVRIARTLV
ncbi:MAG: bifunctional aspartate kinase/homoserine dehydrogenase I [Spirochaetaceae bacterium]|jgi:aspartokinase/homoserine dehydrogenase 1|nr:bifunctional aspartate kinase/homoserine dehydrogenase I [Spirochaetaceae bacterium]